MQQALEALENDAMQRTYAGGVRIANAAIALRAALAEPEQEPVACISTERLSQMFHRLEGIDQNQSGYHWKKGWNDALRQAMDYCQAAPTPQPEQKGWFTVSELNEWATKLPQTTHWEGCEAVHPECKATPRKWVGLTESEIVELAGGDITRDERMIVRAIETKLKEKNT